VSILSQGHLRQASVVRCRRAKHGLGAVRRVQLLPARWSGQMLTRDVLRVAFAWAIHVEVQMPGVGAPMIGGVAGQLEGLEQCLVRQKDFVFATTKDIGKTSPV